MTFLSPEAVQDIKSYLTVERENMGDSQPLFTKFRTNDEPLDPIAIVHTYSRLCDSLGWSKEGNAFRKITGHMGRKWLKTNLANAGMPREPLETLLGHQLRNGTDDNYYLMHEDQLKSIYMKYLPHITINPVETLTLESDEYKALKEENEMLRATLEELKGRVDSIEERGNEVRDLDIDELKVYMDANRTLANNLVPKDAENRAELIDEKYNELMMETWEKLPLIKESNQDISTKKSTNHNRDALPEERISELINEIVDSNKKMVEKRGMGAIGPLMSMAMKELNGKADGKLVIKFLKDKIQNI